MLKHAHIPARHNGHGIDHSTTINNLARRGLIDPVGVVLQDGTRHSFNSIWAATDWLKARGLHQEPHKVYFL